MKILKSILGFCIFMLGTTLLGYFSVWLEAGGLKDFCLDLGKVVVGILFILPFLLIFVKVIKDEEEKEVKL